MGTASARAFLLLRFDTGLIATEAVAAESVRREPVPDPDSPAGCTRVGVPIGTQRISPHHEVAIDAAGIRRGEVMNAPQYSPPPCAAASSVFKRRGRWYVRVPCPACATQLRVRLSLGPMVARCDRCAADVEADVTPVITTGRA